MTLRRMLVIVVVSALGFVPMTTEIAGERVAAKPQPILPPPPPIGPARPVQVYFAKGKLFVRVMFQQLKYESHKLVNGGVLTYPVESNGPLIPLLVEIDQANVQAFNHRGEPIRPSEWVRLLKKERPALLCSGCRIDPELLPLLREGTLILQVPRDEKLMPRVPADAVMTIFPPALFR